MLWNEGARRVLGYESEAVLGKKCYEIIQGLTADNQSFCRYNCSVVESAKKRRVASPITLSVRTAAGTPKLVSVSNLLVPESRSEPVSLVHLIEDSSEDKRTGRVHRNSVHSLTNNTPVSLMTASTGDCKWNGDLTRREEEVLRLLTRGFGTDTIGEELYISRTTVRSHVQSILAKLGVHSRLEAVAAARRFQQY